MKIVGIWIRVSTMDQARGDSPEHHEQRARLYAESKGWEVATVYHLEAISGKSVMSNPECKRMLHDIKEGKITGLIFSKLARLGRNMIELLEFANYFRKHNADLISLQEAIDTSTAAGRLFFANIAAMAQFEREETADRVAASVPIRAKLGKTLGGAASFGYKWQDKKTLVIDEKEGPIRKLMYELFLKHKRKHQVADILTSQGHRTRKGEIFSTTTIDRLLRDSTAKGIRVANYTKSLGEGKTWTMKPKEDWVLQPCPAVISEEVWDECNRILDGQYKKRIPSGPSVVQLLSGYITCSCGTKMYVYHVKKKNPRYACRGCKRKILVADMDAIYQEQLKHFLLTDIDVSDYVAKSDVELQEKQSIMKDILKQSQEISKKMSQLVDMRMGKEMSKENFQKHYQPFEIQLAQIEQRIPELQAEIDFLKIQNFTAENKLEDAKDLYNQWPNLSFEEKRSIIETITQKVEVGNEDITISLSYLPSAPQKGGKSSRTLRDS